MLTQINSRLMALFFSTLCLGFLPIKVQAKPPNSGICREELGAKIDKIIQAKPLERSRWGILIQTENINPITLYDHDAKYYFIPASNTKLITTAAILEKLNPEMRIITSIYGTKNGSLVYIPGRGDPSLDQKQLISLVAQLKQRGIKKINQLIANDTYFKGPLFHPNWQWEDVQSAYGAPVNSLIYNQNSIEVILSPKSLGQPLEITFPTSQQASQWQIINQTLTVDQKSPEFIDISRDFGQPIIRVKGQLRFGAEPDSEYIPVSDPTTYFLEQFQLALTTAGIRVENIKIDPNFTLNPDLLELARIQSPHLAEFIKEVNQKSDNLYAEVLLRILGTMSPKLIPNNPDKNTDKIGLEMIKNTLNQLGIEPNSYILADGSGLSRTNLVSPQALVQILQNMSHTPHAKIYRDSLPIAGVSGTLRHRFKNTTAQGIVQAKTGTLSGVSALSGYIKSPHYRPLVFSIIVNQSDADTDKLRKSIDEIVILLTTLRDC